MKHMDMELPAWLKDPKPITSLIAAITALIVACTGLVKACDKRLEQASYETLAHAITDLQKQQAADEDEATPAAASVCLPPTASATMLVSDIPDGSADASVPVVIAFKPSHPPRKTPKDASAPVASGTAVADAGVADAAVAVADASVADAAVVAVTDASTSDASANAPVVTITVDVTEKGNGKPAFLKAVERTDQTQYARPAPKPLPSWEVLRQEKDL